MAVRTAAELQQQIDTLLADNDAGDISEGDIRSVLTDIKDSMAFLALVEEFARVGSLAKIGAARLEDGLALPGTPTAATAAAGTNTTQIATTAFVAAALAALVDSSPGTLDTLNELATALGDDPNFATTITDMLALKAPLESPDLTGTPTVPTAGTDVSTTQAASTAFVKSLRWKGTQAEYDAIANKDENVEYNITE